ncbi:MAG TPA: hypothetical protein VM490_18970 [Armatimonadaceae bacterium]|nr:hypothetical protein [Armatimonadaceae bacterium]
MSGTEVTLDTLARMTGVFMAAVVDAESGHCVACRAAAAGSGPLPYADGARVRRQVERAARYVAATVAARRGATSGRLPVESVLTLRGQCHVARLVPGSAGDDALLLYLSFDRDVLDFARVRQCVGEVASAVQLSPEEQRALWSARQTAATGRSRY